MNDKLSFINPTNEWLDRLQERGYRLTGSRRTVVEIIACSQRVISPLEVYEQARSRTPGLGLVTVYRTVEKLEELGLIQRVHRPNGCQAFVASQNGHQHLLICKQCGNVQYFSGDQLESLMHDVESESGYQVSDHWLQLFGLCVECQA